MHRVLLCLFTLAVGSQLNAQLILSGPIPKTSNPPVVFINGYQNTCGGPFSDTFFAADKFLQAQGIVSLFFDNCSVAGPFIGKPSLEAEGNALGQFIAALKYTDGTSVPRVDVIAHSMGGLILRAYLAGMQDGSPATFKPPADPRIRRIIFIGTPHFGSVVAGLGFDKQANELSPGSQFLFDLNSWNQGTDDLRGIDAITIVGNGGTGDESGIPGFDDGVANLTSASLSFYRPGVTRILPYCHTSSSLLTLAHFCSSNAPFLTNINTDPNNPVTQIITSFLSGTSAWKSVGQAIESNSLALGLSGLNLEFHDKNDQLVGVSSATIPASPRPINLGNNNQTVAFADEVPAGTVTVQVTPQMGAAQSATVKLPATTQAVAIVKPGPTINPKGVIPAVDQLPFPYDVAPGEFVAIYGSNLASSAKVQLQPYPAQVDDVQVLVNGSAVPIQFAGPGQINIVYPINASGLTQLTVKNSGGQQTVNVRVAPTVPAIFQLDANGTAAAVNATAANVIGPNTPIHAGDNLSLYLTGLGVTDARGGLDYARVQPTVSVGGQDCAVSYAGRAPSFAGLDQINCKIPTGVTTGAAVPVIVNAGGRQSGTVTLNIR